MKSMSLHQWIWNFATFAKLKNTQDLIEFGTIDSTGFQKISECAGTILVPKSLMSDYCKKYKWKL